MGREEEAWGQAGSGQGTVTTAGRGLAHRKNHLGSWCFPGQARAPHRGRRTEPWPRVGQRCVPLRRDPAGDAASSQEERAALVRRPGRGPAGEGARQSPAGRGRGGSPCPSRPPAQCQRQQGLRKH